MTIRVVLAMTWSFVSGLAGGWLILSPWALGEQPSTGSWTAVTTAQVRTGVGLLALALVGLGLVVGEGISALREAGVLRRRTPVAKPWDSDVGVPDQRTAPNSEDLDRAMIALANALAADLNRDRRPGASEGARSVDTQRED
jgi:hypothetical protein